VELRMVVRLLRDRWVSILIVVLLATGAGALLTWRQTPQYAARATLFVSAWTDVSDASKAYQASLLSQQKVKSYTELLNDHRLMQSVVDRLKLRMTPDQLAGKVVGEATPDTVLIVVTAVDPSPVIAAQIANATAAEFVLLVPSLESAPDSERPAIRVTVASPAEVPTAPVSPVPVRNLAVALAIGLLIGIGLAAARQSLDTTLKSLEQAEEVSGGPSLGAVPYDATANRNAVATGNDLHGHRAEAYRKIRTSLQFVDVDRAHKVLLTTSCVPAEGKSVTACNLASSLAEAGRRVLLIDADLRRPRAARYLGLPSGAGLTSVLLGKVSLTEAIQVWGGANQFSVLASGAVPPNPSEMLGSRNMHEILNELREKYDVVVIDAPPVLPVADALAIAPACDGALLVVRYGKTRRDQLANAVVALRRAELDVLGTVLNFAPRHGQDSYYYYRYASDAETAPSQDGTQEAVRDTARTTVRL
jgi:capsular exopolysaccharide synthesis family protein